MKSNNIYSIIIIFLFHLSVFTQNSLNINDYKYVSVPDRFDFLKTSDQYQLNSLTEFLLKKNGYYGRGVGLFSFFYPCFLKPG